MGLYTGYSATLLRNLPASVLSYSSFEYLKSAILSHQADSQGGRLGRAHTWHGAKVLHRACFLALGYFAFETVRLAILTASLA
ncbi:hypothetical protein Fmac_020165 [Flemingia macrophylla]|uniref:Uncharacterized protein n=1 Tax=Flemingia macrophylla TaxID=520843 RepID=A0ABD1LTC1_9FABA